MPAACYAPAGYVRVDCSGGTLRFSCAAHPERWRERISVPDRVLTTAKWVAAGCSYRGRSSGPNGWAVRRVDRARTPANMVEEARGRNGPCAIRQATRVSTN